MTNIGSANMIHRLRKKLMSDERLVDCRPQLHHAIAAVEVHAKAVANRECLDFSCSEEPIGSHLIPDAFLTRLAAAGSPVVPHIEGDTGTFESMVGKTRPIFPGYCETHDRALFPWETDGDLSRPHSAESQLMRVADAMWIEYRLRASLLACAAHNISADAIETWPGPIGPQARGVLKITHDSWLASSEEMSRAADDMHELRSAIRRNLKLLVDGESEAVIGTVTIPADAGHFVLLADGAWIPDQFPWTAGDLRHPVPFVVSVLFDAGGTRLSFASTKAGSVSVELLAALLGQDIERALTYVVHWMCHGNFLWYAEPDAWADLDQDTKDQMKGELERGPFVSVAVYGRSRIETLPILRYGNGWG